MYVKSLGSPKTRCISVYVFPRAPSAVSISKDHTENGDSIKSGTSGSASNARANL